MANSPALAASPIRTPAAPTMARAELLAGLAFLEQSRNHHWGVLGLREWFDEHLVQTGSMRPPIVVTELSAGTTALHGSSSHGLASQSNLPKVLIAARIRVLAALRGLVASPTDDRFLTAAIFTGRVRRARTDGASRWVVRPEPTATLSSIVLALFAADVLAHREMYDRALCVCETCERVTFEYSAAQRTGCPEHLQSVSGFIRRVTASQDRLGAASSATKPSF
jgi:hypothetical protein